MNEIRHQGPTGALSSATDLVPRLAQAFVAFCRQTDHSRERLEQILRASSGGDWDEARCELLSVVCRGERLLTFEVTSEVGKRFYLLVARGDAFLLPQPTGPLTFYSLDLFDAINCTDGTGVTPSNITSIVPVRLHQYASRQWRATTETEKGKLSNAPSAANWLTVVPIAPEAPPEPQETAPWSRPSKRKRPKSAHASETEDTGQRADTQATNPPRIISIRTLAITGFVFSVVLLGVSFFSRQTHVRPGTLMRLTFQGGWPIDFCTVAPGRFLMGSTNSDRLADGDEFPQTEVVITRSFYLSRFELTQQDWEAIFGQSFAQYCLTSGVATNGLNFGPRFPATCVSFAKAEEFCRQMSSKATGLGLQGRFRLPTEAEWEYACRAGSKTAFCYGDKPDPNRMNVFIGDQAGQLREVNGLATNQWGLVGMHGNAAEWVRGGDFVYSGRRRKDYFLPPRDSDLLRLHRGGCYLMKPERARSAARNVHHGTDPVPYIGFRVLFEQTGS